jgi:signal transduction histidine kinase
MAEYDSVHTLELVNELRQKMAMAEIAQAHAEQANAEMARFFEEANHDLRQPVQAIELFAAALSLELQGRQSRQMVEKIRILGREVSELLSALLEFSRIDTATIHPVVCDFSIASLLKRMADDFVPQAKACGRCCRVVTSSAWVRSDPVLLERMVRHLMSSAIKSIPPGKILLGCRRVREGLRIEIHNTGIGIHPHHHKDVVDPLTHIDGPEHEGHEKLDLGLAIVDGLARLLVHPLSLRSQAKQGAMFAVTVPLSAACEKDLTNAASASKHGIDKNDGVNRHRSLWGWSP